MGTANEVREIMPVEVSGMSRFFILKLLLMLFVDLYYSIFCSGPPSDKGWSNKFYHCKNPYFGKSRGGGG